MAKQANPQAFEHSTMNLSVHHNQEGILKEIPNIPDMILVQILNEFGICQLKNHNGDIKSLDGKTWLRNDLEKPLIEYVESASDLQLQDTLNLDEAYVITVTNIVYENPDCEPLSKFVYVIRIKYLTKFELWRGLSGVISNYIAQDTGSEVKSCEVEVLRYTPFQGTVLVQ